MIASTCSLKHAAATLGLHRNTLADWLAKGCPAVTRADRASGAEWQLSIPDIVTWRGEYLVREAVASYQTEDGHVTKEEADRRRAHAMAVIAEVEADHLLRRTVSVADASASTTAFCQVLKTGLANAAHKIAGRATTITSAPEIETMVKAEMNRAFASAKAELELRWTGPQRDDSSREDGEDDDTE